MTSRENRGGARVPDGAQRPASLPFVAGPNRSDMSALPGTPGTPLPPAPGEPTVQHGQGQSLRQQLGQIPLEKFGPPEARLNGPSARPNEPITAGTSRGPGAGPEALAPSPFNQGNKQATADALHMYPVIARLAALPNASQQTKILAQRMRGMLPQKPERMPHLPG